MRIFFALALHAHDARLKIDLVGGEAHELAHAPAPPRRACAS